MNVYIPLGLFLTLLCFFLRNNPGASRNAFFFSMIATFIFAAIRYEFGPDYFNYQAIYNSIEGTNLDGYIGKGMTIEKPFLILLSSFPNFTSFVVFLAIIWFIPTTYFLNRYISPSYYWVAIMYLFIRADYFLSSLVAMRTTLCAAIFLYALFFLLKRKRLIYVALIVLASRFHTSSIVLVIFVFFNTKSHSVVFNDAVIFAMGLIALLSVLSGENRLIEYITSVVMDNIEELQRYSDREVGGTGQSLNSLLFRIISFVVLFYLAKSGEKEKSAEGVILYKIAICAAALSLIFGQSLISDRYLTILNPVFIICIILSFSKNPQNFNIVIVALLAIVSLYIFYSKSTRSYFVSFLQYHTIFTAPSIP